MTNSERFKTPIERRRAYNQYFEKCEKENSGIMDEFEWLDLEYKEKPKPCPFCGHTEVDIVLSRCHGGFDACCKDCGATVIAESNTRVIEKWNRRV